MESVQCGLTRWDIVFQDGKYVARTLRFNEQAWGWYIVSKAIFPNTPAGLGRARRRLRALHNDLRVTIPNLQDRGFRFYYFPSSEQFMWSQPELVKKLGWDHIDCTDMSDKVFKKFIHNHSRGLLEKSNEQP